MEMVAESRVSKATLRKAVVKAPDQPTTNGLCYRFQILYRSIQNTALRVVGSEQEFSELGPLQTIDVIAETPGQARWQLEQDETIKVVAVGVGIPAQIDPAREIFDKAQAAAFLGVEPGTIETWMQEGILPKAPKGTGYPRWTRATLIQAAVKHMRWSDGKPVSV